MIEAPAAGDAGPEEARPVLRFAAFLGTLDDADILPTAIGHLRDIGVSTIVALDYGSTDGSLDILAEAETHGDVWLLHPRKGDVSGTWRRLQASLARGLDADRVLFLDADELWLPAGGNLAASDDARDHDVLSVMRFNVVTGTEGPLVPGRVASDTYDAVLVHAQPVPDLFHHMQASPETAWIEGQLEPKVMARPAAIAALHPGIHDVDTPGDRAWSRAIATDIVIAHLPFRSFEQFEHKARNVTEAIAQAPGWFVGGQGWQWVRWADLLKSGRIREEWERQVLASERLAEARASGAVRSVAEILARVIPDYRSIEDLERAGGRAQPWIMAAGAACKRARVPATSWSSVLAGTTDPVVRVHPGHVVRFARPGTETEAHALGEVDALRIAERDAELPVPRLAGQGRIDDWAYTLVSVVPGVPFAAVREGLAPDQGARVAAWLGEVVRGLHALELMEHELEAAQNRFREMVRGRLAALPTALASGRVLPPHLLAQLGDWLPTIVELEGGGRRAVLVHGDLHDGHVLGYHDGERFHPAGIIDFRRACLGHPFYELGPVWTRMARGDGALMGAFLGAAGLPGSGGPGFPRLALAWCLIHPSVAAGPLELPGIEEVPSLDALADGAFAMSPS